VCGRRPVVLRRSRHRAPHRLRSLDGRTDRPALCGPSPGARGRHHRPVGFARWDAERLVAAFTAVAGDEVGELARRDFAGEELSEEDAERVYAAFGTHVPDEGKRAASPQNRALNRWGMAVVRRTDILDQLGMVSSPTLVCVGERDPVTPVGASEEIVAALPDSLGSLEVIRDADGAEEGGDLVGVAFGGVRPGGLIALARARQFDRETAEVLGVGGQLERVTGVICRRVGDHQQRVTLPLNVVVDREPIDLDLRPCQPPPDSRRDRPADVAAARGAVSRTRAMANVDRRSRRAQDTSWPSIT
jgi:hypothetical protein